MFGYGAREAVVRALAGDDTDRAPFGAPAPVGEMAAAVARVLGTAPEPVEGGLAVPDDPRLGALVFAHGWAAHRVLQEGPEKAVIRPLTP